MMYREPKKDLLLVLIISALLHLLLLIFFLLSKIGSSVSQLKQKKDTQKKEAQVVYKKPKQVKRYAPKLTSGTAGFVAPVPPTPSEKIDKDASEKDQPVKQGKEKPPLPFQKKSEKPESKKKPPKPPQEKKLKKTALEEKKQARIKKPKPVKPPEKKELEKIIEPKKEKAEIPEKLKPKKAKHLTLADITKNIFQYAQRHDVRKPVGMDHLVNITGNNYGKTTAEQLRYERYAAKLLKSMQTSLVILLRKFRFIQKPAKDLLQFQFTMDLNQGGRIASMRVDKSSGSHQFDQLMIKMIKHAAETFPPLPAFLKEYDVCAFPINYVVPVKYIQTANLYSQTKPLAR